MATDFKCVSEAQWCADCDTPLDIRAEIVAEVSPKKLVSEFVQLTVKAFESQRCERVVAFYDEPFDDPKKCDFRRSCILVANKSPTVFNKFFNGRCGYRAMYWHSADVGATFNHYVVKNLLEALLNNSKSADSPVFTALRLTSLKHKEAKIWPFFEKRTLDIGRLAVSNWRPEALGTRIFDPAYPVFLVKGAFLNETGKYQPTKTSRSDDLHSCGFT